MRGFPFGAFSSLNSPASGSMTGPSAEREAPYANSPGSPTEFVPCEPPTRRAATLTRKEQCAIPRKRVVRRLCNLFQVNLHRKAEMLKTKYRPTALTLLIALAGLSQYTVAAEPANAERARFDYMMNCQGCHLPDGDAAGDVPRMKGFVGNFLKVPGGREFLVRVPGSANAALNDARLAELLNWMLLEISPDELPADFRPYTASEVGAYRANPLRDVLQTRAELIQKIAALPHR